MLLTIKNFLECSIMQPQLVELCSLRARVDTILVFDTLKHRELQLIVGTTTGLDTIQHKILNSIKGEKSSVSRC